MVNSVVEAEEEVEEETEEETEEVDLKLPSIGMINTKEEIENQEEIEEKKGHRLQEVVKEIEEHHWKTGIEIIEEVVEVEEQNKMMEELQCMELEQEEEAKDQDRLSTNLLGNGNIEMGRDLYSIMIRSLTLIANFQLYLHRLISRKNHQKMIFKRK